MGAANGPCQCPGQKENIVDLQVPAYGSGANTNGGTGGPPPVSGQQAPAGWNCCCSENEGPEYGAQQYHYPGGQSADYVPQMTNPYSADMKATSSPDNVPPLDQQDFTTREDTVDNTAGGGEDGEEDDRTPAEWQLDQEQFSHLPALPEGWIRVRSRTSGEIYYCFAETGETTFTEPTGPPGTTSQEDQGDRGGIEEELPPGWIEVVSRSSGKTYYWNAQLQKSQFDRPTAADATGSAEGENMEDKLPPGWIKMLSKSTGKYYYFHTETQVSQFEKPS